MSDQLNINAQHELWCRFSMDLQGVLDLYRIDERRLSSASIVQSDSIPSKSLEIEWHSGKILVFVLLCSFEQIASDDLPSSFLSSCLVNIKPTSMKVVQLVENIELSSNTNTHSSLWRLISSLCSCSIVECKTCSKSPNGQIITTSVALVVEVFRNIWA